MQAARLFEKHAVTSNAKASLKSFHFEAILSRH
jgi:hypothetical protein